MAFFLLSLCFQLPLRERLHMPRTTGHEELPGIGARAMGLSKYRPKPMAQINHSSFKSSLPSITAEPEDKQLVGLARSPQFVNVLINKESLGKYHS